VLSIRDLEKDAIRKALDKTKGSKRKAARLLNISERTLYRKLKEYDLVES
jgi:transcriptional regulator with PAS, ATPase and Fis domain